MHRRDFLKLALLTASAEFIDYEKLLWIPGEKKIFIPSKSQFKFLTQREIVAIELERIAPYLKTLFERDEMFYKLLDSKEKKIISDKGIRFPLTLKPDIIGY